jgi:hypothetical protein
VSGVTTARPRRRWRAPLVVFVLVLAAQWVFVAGAGTDVPFHEQWDVEGRDMYPKVRDGTWAVGDLLRAHNEHRIAWTRALDLALFALNGQWDPLLQLMAGALVRAAAAAALVWSLAAGLGRIGLSAVAAGVTLAYLPHLAWHNALWGFQSQVYFALLFSVVMLALLGVPGASGRRQLAGLAAGGAALLAMGPAALAPLALLGVCLLRGAEQRRWTAARWQELWPALALLALGLMLRPDAPAHAELRSRSFAEFWEVAGRVLSWPHGSGPMVVLLLNAPLVAGVVLRVLRRRTAAPGEDFVLLAGGWGLLTGLATAWMRGGGDELAAGLPSRYVDFIVLLPLANAWFAFVLASERSRARRPAGLVLAATWLAFLLTGWAGLSAEVIRGLVVPRWRDREAPVRLMRAYQLTGDEKVFAGQPRLYVPHPNLAAVRAVLADPRLRGALPPSLQPEAPRGPLSQAARRVLGHGNP